MKEAERKLNMKGYYIENQFDGFNILADQFELYKGEECVIDNLSEAQVIALAEIL